MKIIDRILRLIGIRRIDLDKPLTLLGQDYFKVQEKIYSSPYALYDDVDWGIYYNSYKEDDPNVLVCSWETIKIISTLIHDDNDRVLRAGKIYLDKDERFVDHLAATVTQGKSRVVGRVRYPHYDPDENDHYYNYNDEVYIRIRKEYDEFDEVWKLEVEYILHKPSLKRKPARRTITEDRKRIMDDIAKNLTD